MSLACEVSLDSCGQLVTSFRRARGLGSCCCYGTQRSELEVLVSLLFLGCEEPSLSLGLSSHQLSLMSTRWSPWITLFSKLQFSRTNANDTIYFLMYMCPQTEYFIWQQRFIEHLLYAKYYVRIWKYHLHCHHGAQTLLGVPAHLVYT